MLAVTTLASEKTGALLVIERNVGLRNFIDSGVQLDSVISYDLLVTIFDPATPLHDGAVVIKDERIAAASVFLPLTKNPEISRDLGTRHRAAIGITEGTDAISTSSRRFGWSLLSRAASSPQRRYGCFRKLPLPRWAFRWRLAKKGLKNIEEAKARPRLDGSDQEQIAERVPFFLKHILRKVFLEDWLIKLVALGVTLALWVGVTGLSTPTREQIPAVPITLRTAENLVVSNTPLETASIVVSGDKRRLGQIDRTALRFYLDLTGLGPGEHVVDLLPQADALDLPNGVKVEEISPAYVPIRLEAAGKNGRRHH